MSIREETTEILASLRGVWDEEAVDELDHALQSAAHAIADRADDELVLAAALHDIGHSPLLAGTSAAHDRVAREWLTPRFGPRVGWLAGAHVAAKRFLAATEPGYAGVLSPVSVASLREQGGAAADPAFTANPWWPDAVRLRRYDDAAKDPSARGVEFATVIALADRVAARLAR
ncbi:HD family phosphohydrolase [Mycolicibacterium sp. S2-37]|uniref:HD domain-containing protein n=1 Tax=Mycolicibacterium sp. S2-37 TaxID=2810297 RepID=UPI001A943E88|nr:HD domain-containing protein [Mycolicibacterium sp. S2-37]MBO0677714.1 HD family phosphohydrolase [Mycolicibacterium sp. S2-37]